MDSHTITFKIRTGLDSDTLLELAQAAQAELVSECYSKHDARAYGNEHEVAVITDVRPGSATPGGTCYFPTFVDACVYYKSQDDGFTSNDVRAKVAAGGIHIGEPPTEDGEEAYIVNEKPGRRYFTRAKAGGET